MALTPNSLARRKSGVQIPSPPPPKRQVRASSASSGRRSLHVAAAARPQAHVAVQPGRLSETRRLDPRLHAMTTERSRRIQSTPSSASGTTPDIPPTSRPSPPARAGSGRVPSASSRDRAAGTRRPPADSCARPAGDTNRSRSRRPSMLGGPRRPLPADPRAVCPRPTRSTNHHGADRADADMTHADTGRSQTRHRTRVEQRTRWTPDTCTPDRATNRAASSRTSSTTRG